MLGLLFVLLPTLAPAQRASENLVPNPGFEAYAIPPIGWFYRGVYFSKVMKYWTSPTAASPDVYGPRTRIPATWAEQGFGEASPHGGRSMVGLTLYGCDQGKPHCREYVQVLLNEPLLVGQQYELSCWVRPLPRGLRVDHIGAAFSPDEQRHLYDSVLYLPEARPPDGVAERAGEWEQLRWTFTAKRPADYLLFGNFRTDGQTPTRSGADEPLPFAYYYLDDVRLVKKAPLIDAPLPTLALPDQGLEVGAVVPLDDIHFDFDRDELLPRSYIQLEALYRLLRRRPSLMVRINGHTDSIGDAAYNLDLSERRAAAVVDYLSRRGIAPERMRSRGFGAERPLADNAAATGRRQNRRVEFEVLAL